jgi:hypothetical protein
MILVLFGRQVILNMMPHGEYRCLGPGCHTKLAEDGTDVVAHRLLTQKDAPGDLLVGQSIRHQRQNHQFLVGQHREERIIRLARVAAHSLKHLLRHSRIQ